MRKFASRIERYNSAWSHKTEWTIPMIERTNGQIKDRDANELWIVNKQFYLCAEIANICIELRMQERWRYNRYAYLAGNLTIKSQPMIHISSLGCLKSSIIVDPCNFLGLYRWQTLSDPPSPSLSLSLSLIVSPPSLIIKVRVSDHSSSSISIWSMIDKTTNRFSFVIDPKTLSIWLDM